MLAGATSEGGAAIAFPVMTLAFGIMPAVARDFSFMIQVCPALPCRPILPSDPSLSRPRPRMIRLKRARSHDLASPSHDRWPTTNDPHGHMHLPSFPSRSLSA